MADDLENYLTGNRKAALSRAVAACQELCSELHAMAGGKSSVARHMPRVRELLTDMNKHTHEFNAYHNAESKFRETC